MDALAQWPFSPRDSNALRPIGHRCQPVPPELSWPATMSSTSFHARHPGLVWSVSRPDAKTLIRAALLAPRFHTILDACLEFGLAQVKTEWRILNDDGGPEVRRPAPEVDRILRHIEEGYADAQT
jgi:hypothetical protein